MSFAPQQSMRLILIVVLLASLCARVAPQGNKEYTLEVQRRINAHGDEFMALALTKDERHLIIGTESGKLIVWDIAGRRILKQLDQGSPVHCVVGLNDSDTFIAAGGWQVFQLGATLVEVDLKNKRSETLYRLRGNLYALHVNEKAGLIATGGDDEFVRVRKLSDLSVVKEFKVELGVPQGVALMNDGRHVVFSAGTKNTPTRISIGDLVTGQSRMLIERKEPFVRIEAAAGGFLYQTQNRLVLAEGLTGATVREYVVERYLETYAVSANGRWIVAANDAGKLFRFETSTGKRTTVGRQNVESLTRLTITNDGRYVYTTEFGSALRRWDITSNTMNELASITGQARTLKLSRDEREIILGGNHRDVAVFDIASGEERLYLKVTASDFYVTNVWLGGDRLLFSTDAGVLFDGILKR